MGCHVIITDPAIDDLRAIAGYIARHDPSAAERVGLRLIRRIRDLREFPEMGRTVPEREDANLRELIEPPYRIVYRVRKPAGVVEVLRFWHAARGEPGL
jgi:plasmid stabilization system protein ParE